MTRPNGPIIFNANTGSDTQASGLGPASAVYGTGASTTGASAVVTGIDTTGVTAGDLLWVLSSSGRQFSIIASVDSGTQVTCDDNFDNTESGRTWAIGGKRATLEDASSRSLLGTRMQYLEYEIQTNQTINSAITLAYGNLGGTGNGPTLYYGTGDTKPVIEQTANDYHFYRPPGGGGDCFSMRNLKFTNSNASKTYASVFYFILNAPRIHIYDCTFGDSTNPIGTTIQTNTGTPRITFDRCVWDSTVYGALQNGVPPLNGSNSSTVGMQNFNVVNCMFKNCTRGMYSTGTVSGSNGIQVSTSVFSGCDYAVRNDDVYNNNSYIEINNCIFHNNTEAVYSVRHPSYVQISGSIFVNNTTALNLFGDNANYSLKYLTANAYYNNGTKYVLSADAYEGSQPIDDLDLTADPFVNAANGDFNINTSNGGGAALRSTSYDLGG